LTGGRGADNDQGNDEPALRRQSEQCKDFVVSTSGNHPFSGSPTSSDADAVELRARVKRERDAERGHAPEGPTKAHLAVSGGTLHHVRAALTDGDIDAAPRETLFWLTDESGSLDQPVSAGFARTVLRISVPPWEFESSAADLTTRGSHFIETVERVRPFGSKKGNFWPMLIAHAADYVEQHGVPNDPIQLEMIAFEWLVEHFEPSPRGRGAKIAAWWPTLGAEVLRMAAAGELPTTQAALEETLAQWLHDHGHKGGAGTLRPMIRELYQLRSRH
jgi:hypothetical protein